MSSSGRLFIYIHLSVEATSLDSFYGNKTMGEDEGRLVIFLCAGVFLFTFLSENHRKDNTFKYFGYFKRYLK